MTPPRLLGATACSILVGCSLLVDTGDLLSGAKTTVDAAAPAQGASDAGAGGGPDAGAGNDTDAGGGPDDAGGGPALGPPIGLDGFERTIAAGLGFADVGGQWTVGLAPSWSVEGGRALVVAAAGQGPTAHLDGVSGTGLDVTADLVSTQEIDGSGSFSVVTRRVNGVGSYRATLQLERDGTLNVTVARVIGTATDDLKRFTLPMQGKAGIAYRVRGQAVGTTPTTLRGKVWRAADPEPVDWNVTATDATASLQVAGSPALHFFVSPSATTGPYTLAIDNFVVRPTAP